MIKLIIFDLDGVLIDAKNIHYQTLNMALGPKYEISWDEHLSIFDGLKTNQKLEILTNKKNLPKDDHKLIWEKKQKYTLDALSNIIPSDTLIEMCKKLKSEGYKLGCCTNSIKNTLYCVLSKLKIIEYFDVFLSNEDVKNSKPHPEIYWKAISEIGVYPDETLILEDSPYGLMSAHKSNSHVLRITTPSEINYNIIKNKINELNMGHTITPPKWFDKNLNVLIPMAGAGSRFEKAGYSFPKPLIDVNGEPMIKVVCDNLNLDANFIFIVQKNHRDKFNLDSLLNLITNKCNIIEVDGLTEGAACTTLLAKNLIDNDNPLLIANSDQYLKWNSNEFMYKMNETQVDGGIVTFNSTHPKWSFVKINDLGYVTEVAEKKPISDIATTGIYYWKKGSDYVKFAEQMINKNIRVNNEFYVCPVFNEAILEDKKIITFMVDKMYGIGTPEDLDNFLNNYDINIT